jgi:hypothetical protein
VVDMLSAGAGALAPAEAAEWAQAAVASRPTASDSDGSGRKTMANVLVITVSFLRR